MSESLHEMIAFVLENEAGLSKGRARSVASYFADIGSFVGVKPEDLAEIRGIGRRRTMRLTNEEIKKIMEIKEKRYIVPTKTVSENFLSAISREFTKRQFEMIRGIGLDNLSPNPFLINPSIVPHIPVISSFNKLRFSKLLSLSISSLIGLISHE